MDHFPLEDALEKVRQDVDLRQWQKAESLLKTILDQLPLQSSRLVFSHYIHLLIRQNRGDTAARVLQQRLAAEPVIKHGVESASPHVAVLMGLQQPEIIIQSNSFDTFQFEINSGHFKILDVLSEIDCQLSQIFLAPDQDLEKISSQVSVPDIIINTIADPEREGRSLERAHRLIRLWGERPVINAPALVASTSRSEVHDSLQNEHGLVIPKTLRWDQRADCPLPATEFDWAKGVLARTVGTQTAIGMEKHSSPDSLEKKCEEARGHDFFLTQFHDFISPDGFYRKYRCFSIGGDIYPEHLLISDHWNIHSADRLRCMLDKVEFQDEESAFLKAPAKTLGTLNYKVLERITAKSGLDYIGIDFALLPDRKLLIFETNPAMRINLDYVGRFSHQQPALDSILVAFRNLIRKKLANGRSNSAL